MKSKKFAVLGTMLITLCLSTYVAAGEEIADQAASAPPMPMHGGHGMMMPPGDGGMTYPELMQQQQAMMQQRQQMMQQRRAMMEQKQARKQEHMARVEAHLANIEALLRELVELQKK